MQKMMSDIYIVEQSYPLDSARSSCLQLLYQPIIGYQAISLYLLLQQESKLKQPSLHSRLTKCTGMSLSAIEQSLMKLEAIGLLHTFKKQASQITYIYQLHLPMSPKRFYQHLVLNKLLLKRLPKEEYQKTKSLFLYEQINKDDCKEITCRFSDIFDITQLQASNDLNHNDSFIFEQVSYVEDMYDIELFFQGIEQFQIKKDSLSTEDIQIIQQAGTLYRIHPLDMQLLVKENMSNQKLHHQEFMKSCQVHYDLKMPTNIKEAYHTQPITKKSVSSDNKEQVHIQYLESVSPYRLLKDKFGGREPLKRDLVIVESMLTSLQLEPGVVNVLIEYTLMKCDGAISRGFMEYHGGKWKRNKIHTVKEAMDVAKKSMNELPEESIEWTAGISKKAKNTSVNETTDDDLDAILAKFD